MTRAADNDEATFFCDHAWLGASGTSADVRINAVGGVISSLDVGATNPPGAIHLRGVTLPGFANVHSHAFHRALRGRTQSGRGTFWEWRDEMYAVAERLDPDTYFALARATYAEMLCAGYTTVGEFHYLHHQVDGTPYGRSNAMGEACIAAARDVGIKITLIDACYLTAAPGAPVRATQRRFADHDAGAWAERTAKLTPGPNARLGAAIHSVRAVPPAAAAAVATIAGERGIPLHFHLSEQPAENESCAKHYGISPTALLDNAGALRSGSLAVHATHLSEPDLLRLASSGTAVCICPTTERDLADGIGPAARLAAEGAPLSIGSDSQAVIDPFAELQGLELDERLATGRRGHFSSAALLVAGGASGHQAIGWPECGRIAPGAAADLVSVRLDSTRLAGAVRPLLAEHVVFSASSADVDTVVVNGQVLVQGGRHLGIGDVGAALAVAIRRVVGQP